MRDDADLQTTSFQRSESESDRVSRNLAKDVTFASEHYHLDVRRDSSRLIGRPAMKVVDCISEENCDHYMALLDQHFRSTCCDAVVALY